MIAFLGQPNRRSCNGIYLGCYHSSFSINSSYIKIKTNLCGLVTQWSIQNIRFSNIERALMTLARLTSNCALKYKFVEPMQ